MSKIERHCVYIAGGMRGYDKYNFPAFDRARDKWIASGWNVISPADMDRTNGFDENITHTLAEISSMMPDFIRRDVLALIDECDAIALLPAWEKSEGARHELDLAKWLGYKIYDAETMEEINV